MIATKPAKRAIVGLVLLAAPSNGTGDTGVALPTGIELGTPLPAGTKGGGTCVMDCVGGVSGPAGKLDRGVSTGGVG